MEKRLTRRTQRLEQTVTASFVERGDDRVPRREVTVERKLPHFGREVVGMAILSLVCAAIAGWGWQYNTVWLMAAGAIGFICLWMLFMIYLANAYRVLELPAVETDDGVGEVEPEPEPISPPLVQIPRNNGQLVEFPEPKPAETAVWFTEIMRDKASLSQNTAMRRGWSRDGYQYMLAAMVKVGWVGIGKNRVPEFTQEGRERIDSWLRW